MITIKKISERDAPEVAALSQQLGYSISVEQTLQNIVALKQSEYDEAFVAVYEGRVIGWIGVSHKISIESPPLCEVHGLVVHEQFRGKGIGKKLIGEAKQWSRSKGMNRLRLRCNLKRTEAILFYKKIGFAAIKEQKVFEINV